MPALPSAHEPYALESRRVPALASREARSAPLASAVVADRSAGRPANHLLAALPPAEYSLIAPHLQRVRLSRADVLQCRRSGPTHVYFPESAVAAVVLDSVGNRRRGEIMSIGREGMIGLSLFLSGRSGATDGEEIVASIAGDASRMGAAEFLALLGELPTLQRLLGRYTQSLLSRIARTALCDREHPLEQRLATLLLLMHDRMADDRVPITHRQLGSMLGVRRAGVTEAAGRLREGGAIQYKRGAIIVSDRARLEESACGCYRIHEHLGRAAIIDDTPS